MYDSDGFVSSNQDTLPNDLFECALKCKNPILAKHLSTDKCSNLAEKEIPGGAVKKAPRRAKSNLSAPTAWTKYKTQLSKLMAMLALTNSRYIRCIKPNAAKVASKMEHVSTIEQLRCAGVVAAVTLSRSAFPNRIENTLAKNKFSGMWDRQKYPTTGNSDMEPDVETSHDCKAILASALADFKSKDEGSIFVVGKTRSYFRTGALEYLEANRAKAMGSQVVGIQRFIRGWFIRKQFQQADSKRRKAAVKIHKWYTQTIKAIEDAEKAAKASAEKKEKDERERVAREKAEAKAKKATEARLAKEKAEREKRLAAERKAEEERERVEREREQLRLKKEQEAIAKFDKDKEKKVKKFKKEIKAKEKDLDEKDKKWSSALDKLEAECEEVEKRRDDILDKISKEEAKLASLPTLSEKDQKKVADSAEITKYIRKENKKLRASTTQLRKDYETMQEQNKRLLEANAYAGASFEAMNQASKKKNNNNSKLMLNLDKYKKQNQKLKDDMRMRSAYYDAEANIRMNYQKSMAEIMAMIQDDCDDAQLTEDILVLALECESTAKSELAAAEEDRARYE